MKTRIRPWRWMRPRINYLCLWILASISQPALNWHLDSLEISWFLNKFAEYENVNCFTDIDDLSTSKMLSTSWATSKFWQLHRAHQHNESKTQSSIIKHGFYFYIVFLKSEWSDGFMILRGQTITIFIILLSKLDSFDDKDFILFFKFCSFRMPESLQLHPKRKKNERTV